MAEYVITHKDTAELAEKVAKHADLSVNVVLRVFYALKEYGHVVGELPTNSIPTVDVSHTNPAAVKSTGKSSKATVEADTSD